MLSGFGRWIMLHLRYYYFLRIDFFVTNSTNENRFPVCIVPRVLKCKHTYVRPYAYTSACVRVCVRAFALHNRPVSQWEMLWPQTCLSLFQINSNCLLQMFSWPVADVPLYLVWPQMHNSYFIMQIGASWAWGNWRAIWKGWPNGWQKCGRGEPIEFSISKMAF